MDVKSKSIKRIFRDLEEIKRSPIEGLGVCIPNESNPFELRANILILDGIYKDLLLHMIMNIPENYPTKAPRMIIAPGQNFTHDFHHHVFEDYDSGGHTICIDLLDHGFFGQGIGTGWTPAYTISTILMQMQIFFGKDYDLPKEPSPEKIAKLKRDLEKYSAKVYKSDKEYVLHSVKEPYPPIYSKKAEKPSLIADMMIDESEQKRAFAREKLTCYVTRCSIDDEETVLGYPVKLNRDKFGRIHILPLTEILSYEGYMLQVMGNGNNNNNFGQNDFDSISLRTANGSDYNYWMPIYTTEETFKKFRQHYFNAFSVFKHGFLGKKEYDFTPDHIISVLPCLMNKMIVHLQKGVLHESIAAIEAFIHFLRLFIKLIAEVPEIRTTINAKVNKAKKGYLERTKSQLGDLGEFYISLAFSSTPYDDKELREALFIENIARNFYWVIDKMEKGEPFFKREQKELANITYGEFFQNLNDAQYKEFYRASKVSNNLLLFNHCAYKQFLRSEKEFAERKDKNFGVLDEGEIMNFIKETNKIKDEINTYQDLLAFMGMKDLATPQSLSRVFKEAWKISDKNKYNKNYY